MTQRRPVNPIRETHFRHLEIFIQHGTPEEKAEALDTLSLMRALKQDHPEGEWEPMEAVNLPGVLVERAGRLAVWRQQEARKRNLKNYHGLSRTLEEEARTVEGQYAACLILGLPFGDRLTWNTAKKNGNLGDNCSAFVPRYGNPSLLIQEKEKSGRWMFLMHWVGGHRYDCKGWCRAGMFMTDAFQTEYIRDVDGVKHVAHPYRVPPEMLSPIREWWR